MEKIIAVDVDLTVVDSLTPWIDWYRNLTGEKLEIKDTSYNLEDLMKNHHDPLEFWRNPNLYDELSPIKDASKFLQKIYALGYEIIFVSSCFPEHERSKEYFLRRNFPYMKAFISTRQKEYINCDVFVDDYDKHCKEMKEKNPGILVYQVLSGLNGKETDITWENIFEELKNIETR